MPFDSSYSKMLRGISDYERNTSKPHTRSLKDSKRAVTPVGIQFIEGLWMGMISVGTPAVQFKVIFDTGSDTLFLAAKGDEDSLNQDLYDPNGSSTSTRTPNFFNIHFADGSGASGKLWTDTVNIGGLTATRQTLGAASEWTRLGRSSNDGVMGLSFLRMRMFNARTVIQRLVDQGQMNPPIFAMKLNERGASLTLGGLDHDLYTGDITYVDVIDRGRWVIRSNALVVGGQTIVREFHCHIDSVCSN
jgi:cathepsin D